MHFITTVMLYPASPLNNYCYPVFLLTLDFLFLHYVFSLIWACLEIAFRRLSLVAFEVLLELGWLEMLEYLRRRFFQVSVERIQGFTQRLVSASSSISKRLQVKLPVLRLHLVVLL